MGAILHPGYHLYNRYAIKNVYSSTSRTITIYDDDPDDEYDPKAEVNLSTINRYAVMDSYFINDDGLYEAKKYELMFWSDMKIGGISWDYIFINKPSKSIIEYNNPKLYATANVLISDCIGRINGVGLDTSTIWVDYIYARDRKLESQSRGEFVDQIVTQEDFPSDGISGDYWYELIA